MPTEIKPGTGPRVTAWLVVLVLSSVLARLAVLQWNHGILSDDIDGYERLALNLAEWGTLGAYDLPTAFRPPLYPLLLSPIIWLQTHFELGMAWRTGGIMVLHLALGAGTTLLTFLLARGLGLWPSIFAAMLVALDPLLLHQAGLLMTETLAAFLIAAALVAMARSAGIANCWRTYAAGAILGLAMLCRTTTWSLAIVVPIAAGLVRHPDGRKNWEWGCVVLVVALLVQLPWFLRNWFTFGRAILTTTHGGYTLALGNNPSYYDDVIRQQPLRAWSGDRLEQWQVEMNIRAAMAGARTEPTRDAYFYQAARTTIAERPMDFAAAVLVRIASFWRVTPNASEYGLWVRAGCALFYVPELLLLAAGLLDRRAWRWPFVLCSSALIGFTVVHSIYWSDMRMRAAIVPAIALLAALGAERVWIALRLRLGRARAPAHAK